MKKKINRVLKTKSSRIILILSLIFLILNTTYEIYTTTIQPPSHTIYVMPQSETFLYSFSVYDDPKKWDFEKCNHWGQGGYYGTYRYKDVTFCDKQVYPENVSMDICFAYPSFDKTKKYLMIMFVPLQRLKNLVVTFFILEFIEITGNTTSTSQ